MEINRDRNKEYLIDLIHKIKSYEEPPWDDDDDIYWLREPWQKFGGVSSGICMCWYWYRDDVILEKATEEDIMLALSELETITGD